MCTLDGVQDGDERDIGGELHARREVPGESEERPAPEARISLADSLLILLTVATIDTPCLLIMQARCRRCLQCAHVWALIVRPCANAWQRSVSINEHASADCAARGAGQSLPKYGHQYRMPVSWLRTSGRCLQTPACQRI